MTCLKLTKDEVEMLDAGIRSDMERIASLERQLAESERHRQILTQQCLEQRARIAGLKRRVGDK